MSIKLVPHPVSAREIEWPTGRTYNGKLTYVKSIPIADLAVGDNVFAHGITNLCSVVEHGGSMTADLPTTLTVMIGV